jgi:hypothetical protein
MPLVYAYAISAGMWEIWARGIYQIWNLEPAQPLYRDPATAAAPTWINCTDVPVVPTSV